MVRARKVIKLTPMTQADFINEEGYILSVSCIVADCPIDARAGCSYVYKFNKEACDRYMCQYHAQCYKGYPYCPEHYNKVSS